MLPHRALDLPGALSCRDRPDHVVSRWACHAATRVRGRGRGPRSFRGPPTASTLEACLEVLHTFEDRDRGRDLFAHPGIGTRPRIAGVETDPGQDGTAQSEGEGHVRACRRHVVVERGGESGSVVVEVGKHRMRLFLVDLPEGLSAQMMAIAIVAPEARFEQVAEAAEPVLESLRFRT